MEGGYHRKVACATLSICPEHLTKSATDVLVTKDSEFVIDLIVLHNKTACVFGFSKSMCMEVSVGSGGVLYSIYGK